MHWHALSVKAVHCARRHCTAPQCWHPGISHSPVQSHGFTPSKLEQPFRRHASRPLPESLLGRLDSQFKTACPIKSQDSSIGSNPAVANCAYDVHVTVAYIIQPCINIVHWKYTIILNMFRKRKNNHTFPAQKLKPTRFQYMTVQIT